MNRFTEKGSAIFANAIANLCSLDAPTEQDFVFIRSLASNREICQGIGGAKQLPAGPFSDRFDMCSRIYNAIKETEVIRNFNPKDSCWSWLTSRYFEELTTFSRKDGSTIRKLSKEREAPAYIWHSNYKKAYRHRIGHGVFMIHNFGERLARPMLLSHPGSMSDYCEQTFARVGSYKEKAVIEAAHSIYTDEGMAIRGASSRRRWGLRHLHREVAQCLVNYEMHEMGSDELLAFLPKEFRTRGFMGWQSDARLLAYLAIKMPDSWHALFDFASHEDAVNSLSDSIGCTLRDIREVIAEAQALDDEEGEGRRWLGTIEAIEEEDDESQFRLNLAKHLAGEADEEAQQSIDRIESATI